MKKCIRCGVEKIVSDFYKHKQMSSGYSGKCKECNRRATRDRVKELSNNPEWVEKEKARHRDKYYRLGYKEKHKPTYEQKKRAIDRYKKRYPEKIKAKNLSGHIKSPIKGHEKHHWSYDAKHAKDIIFLTKKDHARAHRYLKYNQPEKLYYTIEGLKLDNRNDHENYISHVLKLPF